MPSSPNKLSRFFQELKRRHVIKVFIWYAGVAMVLIGLASDVAGPFHLPDGTLRLVIILIIIGFPLAMILSWFFDLSPEKDQEYFSDGIAEEIINAVTQVEKLKVKLGKEKKEVMLKRHTENHEAYQLYLRGFYYWQKMIPEGNQKAQEYYRKALEADPGYALVYSVLGSNFMFAGLLGFIPPEMAVQNGREFTNKALEIDNSISVA
jgi:hypothetical protein